MSKWDRFSPPEMERAISHSLALGLPGRAAQRTMAHSLAYGRHHGPIPDDARRAAVLLALHPTPGGWSVPAVLRPPTMRSHAGQVSLPGGLIEPDETPPETALREFEEELGALSSGVTMQIVGRLTPVYVFVSGFEITPFVAVASGTLAYNPSPHEVAEVVELPLAAIGDPGCRGKHLIERGGLRFYAPHFAIAGRQVWGATSLILAELAALIARL